MLDNYIAKKV